MRDPTCDAIKATASLRSHPNFNKGGHVIRFFQGRIDHGLIAPNRAVFFPLCNLRFDIRLVQGKLRSQFTSGPPGIPTEKIKEVIHH